MTLAFFIIAALDLLGILDKKTSLEERNGWVEWIYECQAPGGGFRGFTGANPGDEKQTKDNRHWDPANVPATFFALLTLIILGDDFSRLKREDCLTWLASMQRENGSIGEIHGEAQTIEGGNDLRFCCCAAGILNILQDESGTISLSCIDSKKLASYVRSCQTYDGGFSEGPGHECHSGLTYCAINTFFFLQSTMTGPEDPEASLALSSISTERCVRWIVDRQTTYIEADEGEDREDIQCRDSEALAPRHPSVFPGSPAFFAEPECAGFNGRPNKIADTCYGFWNCGSLAMLDKLHIVDHQKLRRYLLDKVQHMIGGFGKGIDEPPDVLHAYLGLAQLSLLHEPGLKNLDAGFCISTDALARLQRLSKKLTDLNIA